MHALERIVQAVDLSAREHGTRSPRSGNSIGARRFRGGTVDEEVGRAQRVPLPAG